jgi:SAM-dependent methyltransferase
MFRPPAGTCLRKRKHGTEAPEEKPREALADSQHVHTEIQGDNPFGYDRYGFAWQHVPAGGAAHLDFGCGDGRFLAALRSKNLGRLVGIDGSEEGVQRAQERCPGLDIRHLRGTTPLPFADREFSSISLMDVLEHVEEQEALLDELGRVLRDDGMLVITVPGRHVFSFLDVGNLKFRFPRLHRWYYCRRHAPQEYERRYLNNPDGLVGDVSAQKRWHEHFARGKLASLLRRHGFAVVRFDGAGLFVRVLKIAEMGVGRIGPLRSVVRSLMARDARRFQSAHLFCIARKCAGYAEGSE